MTAMAEQPLIFRQNAHVRTVPDEGVYLLSEHDQFVLSGAIYAHLAPWLDGRFTANEIVDRLAGILDPATIHYAIRRLQDQGHVIALDASVPPERAAFWLDLGLNPTAAEERVRSAVVSVVGVGGVPLAEARAALELAGARLSDSDPGPRGLGRSRPDFSVVLTDDYLQPALAQLNQTMLAAGIPWLILKPVGSIPWLGPIFRPGQSGCWACLSRRVQDNREVESFLQRRAGTSAPYLTSIAALEPTVGAALELAALEVTAALAGAEQRPISSSLLTLELLDRQMTRHPFTRRPQCEVCGDMRLQPDRPPTPPSLRPQPIKHVLDGGYRAVTPEETLSRFERHVSPITGLVSALQRAPSPPETPSIHIYVAPYRAHGQRDTLFQLQRALGTSCGGKGTSDVLARVSALCEGLERHALQFRADDIRHTASHQQLGDEALHPESCLLVSQAQYQARERWNARGSRYNRVPAPFDEDAMIEWSPLWSFTEGRFKYLPTELLYPGYPTLPGGQRYCFADSTGGASGNTFEEAILQGFFELVERDSVAIWWYNRLQRPALDLDSFDEPAVIELRRQYRALGREIWALDLTADLPIPTFAAISRQSDGPGDALIYGFGAHIDPRIALLRAMTEVGQSLLDSPTSLTASAGGAPLDPSDDPDAAHWRRTATLADHPYLTPSGATPRRRSDHQGASSGDLAEDVRWCQAQVEARGLELLVLDATRPDIGLPVVRVVVPGLRPVWMRLAPGRLYDVPVSLDWLSRARSETELNTWPFVP